MICEDSLRIDSFIMGYLLYYECLCSYIVLWGSQFVRLAKHDVCMAGTSRESFCNLFRKDRTARFITNDVHGIMLLRSICWLAWRLGCRRRKVISLSLITLDLFCNRFNNVIFHVILFI